MVRNLTATRYAVEIPAGQKESVSYSFATEMHPQDLRLNLAAILTDSEGKFFTVQAFNGTVSVVEPETSIFDPQMYEIPESAPVAGNWLTLIASSSTSSSWLALSAFATSFTPSGLRPTSRRSGRAARPVRREPPAALSARRPRVSRTAPALPLRLLPPTTPTGFLPTTSTARKPGRSRALASPRHARNPACDSNFSGRGGKTGAARHCAFASGILSGEEGEARFRACAENAPVRACLLAAGACTI